MQTKLNVWFEDTLVGTINPKGKIWMTFAYSHEWLKSGSGFDLSLKLPRRSNPFDESATHAFFSNLLPEQGVRALVERKLQISKKNDLALLNAIGGECAGALTILPEYEKPNTSDEYAPLKRDKLGELISVLPKRPLLADDANVRLSLAGAQSKLSMALIDGEYCVPLHGAPSTLILKPPIDDLPEMVENEAFCMMLAGALGLDVPEVRITNTVPRAFTVLRYDRIQRDGRTTRLHQEDFCQALGVPPEQKYEKEGGPSLADCFALLDHCNDPTADKTKLLDWVIINILMGNADGHTKNISLLYDQPPKPNLAPFYDLICTGVYPGLGTKLAMKIGGTYDPDYVMQRHWERLAPLACVPKAAVLDRVKSLAGTLADIVKPAVGLFETSHGISPTVRRIADFITKRCKQTMDRLAPS